MEKLNGKEEKQELLGCLGAMFSYYVSTVNWKETKARYKKATQRIRQLIKESPIKDSQENVICPYCGKLHDPNEDPEILETLATYHGELEPQQFTCDSCNKDFLVQEHVRRTFEAGKTMEEFDL